MVKSTKVLEVWVDQKQTLGHVSKKTTKWRNSIIQGALFHQCNWENHRIKLSENRKLKVDNSQTLFIDV